MLICLVSEENKVCCAASSGHIDTTLTCQAAGDDGSDNGGACSGVQGNNSNNLVTGPEGDGLVVCLSAVSSSSAFSLFGVGASSFFITMFSGLVLLQSLLLSHSCIVL